jgi:DNA polymerase (family 10)
MKPTNQEIARRLRKHASELARTGDNLYRVRAFRQAAMAVLALPLEAAVIVASDGGKALERYPGIGKGVASTIVAYLDGKGAADAKPAFHLTN